MLWSGNISSNQKNGVISNEILKDFSLLVLEKVDIYIAKHKPQLFYHCYTKENI